RGTALTFVVGGGELCLQARDARQRARNGEFARPFDVAALEHMDRPATFHWAETAVRHELIRRGIDQPGGWQGGKLGLGVLEQRESGKRVLLLIAALFHGARQNLLDRRRQRGS